MKKIVSVRIDGKECKGSEGDTILEIARTHGIQIPTLCNFRGLSAVGACRLCIVEARGVPRLLPACATAIAEGMDITTASPRVVKYRRMILELLFAERNHICAACVASGNCELQSTAQQLGVHHTRYPYRYPTHRVDATHPKFYHDPNRCILCTRCLRACEEVEGARTWGVMGRGINSTMVTDFSQPWGTSQTCTACSKCVQVCPTGALAEKGRSVAEMARRENILPYLSAMRGSGR
jgi:bidirectional [NiFe] hydrogenase diaphorase subunit